MTSITKRFEFDAAHRLMKHKGKCANLHGHRYVVELTVSGEPDVRGMIVDFGEIKRTVGDWVRRHWDHATILNEKDAALIRVLLKMGMKLHVMDCEPTVENMVAVLAERTVLDLDGCSVDEVKLCETPNSWATLSRS